MTTSSVGRALIESFESLRLNAYLPTPHDVPTIGYGHTHNVTLGDVCTSAQADEWLEEDLRAAELAIKCSVISDLGQNQFDALVSFVFNIGTFAFEHSTLLALLKKGDYAGAANQFLAWDRQSGQVLPGLQRRRVAERALFLTQ